MVLDPTALDARFVNEADHDKAAHDALALSHDSLVDVSANDHHAEVHAHTHASTTGRTANDHHAEVHAHTHASTTGRTANDHHAQSHNIASHSDVTITGAEVEDLTAFGSDNAQWINCPLEMWGPTANFHIDTEGRVVNDLTGSAHVVYSVSLPTTRGGKKLYINGTRVSLANADFGDFVSSTIIKGYTDAGVAAIDNDPTDKNTIDVHEDLSMGALDCSGYHAIKVYLITADGDAGDLAIQFVTVRYYYAA